MRGYYLLSILAVAAFQPLLLAAQTSDAADFIEVHEGQLPILLTVPHGGDLKPESLLTRRYGVTAQDSNTVELSLLIADQLKKRFGGRPHLVICRLHRSKLDCNRELSEAAQGDPSAIAAWHRFHHEAETREKIITQMHGYGLTLDIHGHRHEDPRVELGYLLSAKMLNTGSDIDLNNDSRFRDASSVRSLSRLTSSPFADLIRGPSSLGALLEAGGFPSLPSPAKPSPGQAAYFSGAYDITAHGSKEDNGPISAIQLECPWDGVRDTRPHRQKFAETLVNCLETYFQTHFKKSLSHKK